VPHTPHLWHANKTKQESKMFKGLTRSAIIINLAMVGVPALMMMAMDGQDWFERFQLMSPFF
jgi:hypothetical protein